MAKTTEMVEVALSKLKPYERNAKLHPKSQIEKLKNSIQAFGFISPCLIDKENNIIAGHGRVEAAAELGMETVPCVFIEGLTEEQRRAYILADNRLTELGGWDMTTASGELEDLMETGFDINLTGFDIDDIIIDEIEDIDTEPDIEEMDEAEPIVQPGEVWLLGDHRLMCGDSTEARDVEKLVGGVPVDLMVTDPPYNVAYSQKNEVLTKAGYYKNKRTIETATTPIANDDMDEESFICFLIDAFNCASDVMRPGAAFYIFHSDTHGYEFRTAVKATDALDLRQNLVWVKNSLVLGHADYQWIHEPILYGWKKGASHYFIDMRSLTTVQAKDYESMTREEAIEALRKMIELTTIQEENKPSVNDLHPTMKPVPLIKKLIRNSSKEGNIVLDPFGGSGTTLIACEEMNRTCYMMELEPLYADVVIRRWEEKTGRKAKRA